MEIAALLRRIEQQDETALAVLYAQYGTAVYSLVLKITQNETLAQEILQDTFLKVWHKPKAWDAAKGEFHSWLLTTARYTAIDRIRQEWRRTGKDIELNDDVMADDDALTPGDSEHMQSLINQLPDEQRTLIELAYFKGMKHRELAQLLDLPLGTVKTRLRLGLQKLRKSLEDNP